MYIPFELTKKLPFKEHHGRARPDRVSLAGVVLGRVWPDWFIVDIDYMVKKKLFLLHKSNTKKSIVSEMPRCMKVPYDLGKKLSTTGYLGIML